jgi:type IV pilus assembly protein PilP
MKKLLKNRICLTILFALLFGAYNPAQAAEDMVYKEARPLKEIFAKDTSGTESEEKSTDFIYNPTGKTDPFKSFIATREETEKKEKRKPRTYLETLELSQLDLSVIVISPKGRWAMVRDSKGIGHVIKEGTAIGKNGGLVYKIIEGEVVIREEFKDFRGRIQHKDIVKKSPSAQ